MADRYWVGGSGNWDATSTTNWAESSGGVAGASAPTSVDNVFFDAASNVGTGAFTVTVTGTSAAPAACLNFSTGGAGGALDGAMTLTMGATAQISCHGSLTFPVTNLSISATAGASITFRSTTTGQTITTNGVAMGNCIFVFDGLGGGWTAGSAFSISAGNSLNLLQGTFNTGNFSMTLNNIVTSGTATRSYILGSSVISCSGSGPVGFSGASGFTFNAGTSTINCSNASSTFTGNGQTFNNVNYTSTAISGATITGSNTFNNLTFAARAAAGLGTVVFSVGTTNTINGTLTLGSGTTGVARLAVRSNAQGTPATLSVATLAAITDIDFRDITASGASTPWSGTRIGDGLGNSNITFTAARTVYWVSAAGNNWSAAVWNTTSGNTGGTTTSFPLAQDSIIIDDAGLTTGNIITLNASYNIGSLSFSSRSNAATFATGAQSPTFFGDFTLSSAVTVSGTGTFIFAKIDGTATITSAGVPLTQNINQNGTRGTLRINGNLTLDSIRSYGLNIGTLDLTNGGAGNFTLSTGFFTGTGTTVRSIAFGTGNIIVTGFNSTVFNIQDSTNLTLSGTPTVDATYSGSVGTRVFSCLLPNIPINLNISAGSDIISISGGGSSWGSLNFTGFSGNLRNAAVSIYGNLTYSPTMTLNDGTGTLFFVGTSGIQQLTTNGRILDFPINQNGVGGTVQLQDNLTMGSTRTFFLTNGTLDLSNGNRTLSTGLFSSSNSNIRSILFGTGNITVTGNNATIWNTDNQTNFTYTGSGEVNFSYAGATGTRGVFCGGTNGLITNSINVNVTAGTDTFSLQGSRFYKNVNLTGFAGNFTSINCTIYGSFTMSTGATPSVSNAGPTFAATSPVTITTAGKTFDFPLRFNGVGGTFAFQDALTQGSTRAFTITNGTVQLKNGVTNTLGILAFNGTNTKSIQSSLNNSSTTIITNNIDREYAINLTVKDCSVVPNNLFNTYTGSGSTTAGATSYGCINDGNNQGWYFVPPGALFLGFF